MKIEAVTRKILESGGLAVDPESIPLDDPATYRLLAAADTEGVARFDHEDALDFLRRLSPDRFAHLVAFQALNRMSTILTGLFDRYIERRHGREPAACEIPALAACFAESYGLPLYEEQVAEAAAGVAGMDAGAARTFADAFRRFDEDAMPALSEQFVRGARALGASASAADAMIGFLRRTASFTLPRKRLAAFALEGYRLAWLKAHRRVAFEAALREPRGDGPSRPS